MPARSPSRPRPKRRAPGGGFTLVELLVVMCIIGIVLAFILTAAMDGVRRAEERATQALISKLETGLDDRLQALIETRPDYNNAHVYMAAVYNSSNPLPIYGLQRVNVIALYDQIKAEVPDVFYYNPGNPDYPLNFAAPPFPGTPAVSSTHAPYILPLGNAMLDDGPLSTTKNWSSFGASNAADPNGMGIYGASYAAAAGIYKNLGYAPAGHDGGDNNGNGLVDESAEGTLGLDATQIAQITANLKNHQHKTARAEMLYALLVEGQGPLGSSFNRDDFTDREVQDTDHDGLPEFVDGWGEPLQFYRWPVYYHSDLQRGVPVNNAFNAANGGTTVGNGTMNYPYTSVFDAREQNTLDPSQQLLSPSWWSGGYNTGSISGGNSYTFPTYPTTLNGTPLSPGAAAFSMFFHPLIEPMSRGVTSAQPGFFWDRGALYIQRRAFFTKFLIVSSGPDKELGIARLDTMSLNFSFPSGTGLGTVGVNAANLLIESQARQTDFGTMSDPYMVPTDANPTIPATGTTLYDAGQDDISNHNFQAPGGLLQ